MPRYAVSLTTWANTVVDVEADTPEQAKKAAEESDQLPGSLCHQCAGSVDVGDEWNAAEATELEAGN